MLPLLPRHPSARTDPARLCEALSYWYELDVPSILRDGEAALRTAPGASALWRHGLGVVHTVSRQRNPVVLVRVGKHSATAQSTETMHRHMLLSLVSACACAGPTPAGAAPEADAAAGKLVIVFNMAGFTIKNMDWQAVLFAVRYMAVLFPERMERVYIHASPWVFRSVWQMLQPMIEPILPKIRFSSSVSDLAPVLAFPAELTLPPSLGGQGSKFVYPPPAPRETAQVLRADICAVIEAERDALAKEFEATTASWASLSESGLAQVPTQAKEKVVHKRSVQQVQLRLKALQNQPYVRAPTLYHRVGMLHEDGSATFSPPAGAPDLSPVLVGQAHAIPALISWLAQNGGDLMTFSYASRLGAGGIDRTPDLIPTYVALPHGTTSPASPSLTGPQPPAARLPVLSPSSPPPSVNVPSVPARASTVLSTSSRSSSAISPPPTAQLPPLPAVVGRGPASDGQPRSKSQSAKMAVSGPVSSTIGSVVTAQSCPPTTSASTMLPRLSPTRSTEPRPTPAHGGSWHQDESGGGSASGSGSGSGSALGLGLGGTTQPQAEVDLDDPGQDQDDEDALSVASDESGSHTASLWPDYIPRHKLFKADVMQSEAEARADVANAHRMMDLFLNSQMAESEEIARPYAGTRMYMAIALALINSVKAMMTFERVHLETAVRCTKHAGRLAKLLRKKRPKIRLPGWSVTNFVVSMTYVQQQAELIYAEACLIISIVGIVLSHDPTKLARHVLNLRKAYLIIRQLSHFCDRRDASAAKARALEAEGKRTKDPTTYAVDADLRCGVQLSYGICTLVLSLLPSLASKVLGTIGYSSDRDRAISILSQAGGWTGGSPTPEIGVEDEGLHRPLCDITILTYYLFISSYVPIPEVNLELADKVLQFNLQRYPQGFFFLFFQGRMFAMLALPERAMESYRNAITCQHQYRELSHLVYWDLALAYLTLGDHERAFECFDALSRQSSFSKAIFQYSKALSLYSAYTEGEPDHQTDSEDPSIQRAKTIMATVPLLCQKVAGQSIGAECFALGRAKKFIQHGRLTLPGLEFAYIWHTLPHTPVFLLYESAGAVTAREIAHLETFTAIEYNASDESEWPGALALASFLRGTILLFSAFPLDYTLRRLPPDDQMPSQGELVEEASDCFQRVFTLAPQLRGEDVGLIYFAHYELGRLRAATGMTEEAQREFKKVVSGRPLEYRASKTSSRLANERPQFSLDKMVNHRAQMALSLLADPGYVLVPIWLRPRFEQTWSDVLTDLSRPPTTNSILSTVPHGGDLRRNKSSSCGTVHTHTSSVVTDDTSSSVAAPGGGTTARGRARTRTSSTAL